MYTNVFILTTLKNTGILLDLQSNVTLNAVFFYVESEWTKEWIIYFGSEFKKIAILGI